MSPSSRAPTADPAQLDLLRADGSLDERLHRLGLPRGTPVRATRNRSVILSFRPRSGLRLHAGFAAAPDTVLQAIVRFVARRGSRAERLQARKIFMAFPIELHARSRPPRPRRLVAVPEADGETIRRLELAHAELNRCWFGGTLRPIPIHLSHRMRSRLGEWRAHQRDLPEEIVISARHIERQGWTAALDTLLHEMIHQWQAATDRPVKHDAEFRRRAKAVGISPRAKF